MNKKWITNKFNDHYLIDSNDKYMERCLLGSGYQIRNWEFVKSLCSAGGLALDIGASIGMNSLNYGRYFDTVDAFEPDPNIYECLLETISANNLDNITSHPVAVGKECGTNTLVQFPRATFANTLKPLGYIGKSRPQITIQCETIDSYAFKDVNFIKIDVEGYEMNVLLGAEQTIKQSMPVLQIEIKPQMLKRQHHTPQDIFDWLSVRGYKPVHWAGDVSRPHIVDSKKFSANSKYGIEYRIEFDNINKNLVDFWFIKA